MTIITANYERKYTLQFGYKWKEVNIVCKYRVGIERILHIVNRREVTIYRVLFI